MKTVKLFFTVAILLVTVSFANAQDAKYHLRDFGPKLTTASIKVYGECGSCRHRIQNALKVEGVKTANWDENTGFLTVQYNEKIIHLDKIQSLVAAVGHDTEKVRASDVVYNALPDCCRYPRKS
jgi:periplasmic mercuric ion binding protein